MRIKRSETGSGLNMWLLLVVQLWEVSTFVLPVMAMALDMQFTPKPILIFGGNGFIGSRTSEQLLDEGYSLVLVNRGNWYWDSAFTVRPLVKQITCDRAQALEKCVELTEYISTSDGLAAVIDFSAYHPQYLEDALTLLGGKTAFYIYISTDSVYEVCDKTHDEPTLETDAVRPPSPEEQAKRQASESYGHFKLACEEVLEQHRSEGTGPAYISLRLPDVVGPRDNTYRWWIYQLWIRLRPFLNKDVTVPKRLESKFVSLVFVDDVSDIILDLIKKSEERRRQIIEDELDAVNPLPPLNQAYNLALKETPTLLELLTDIRAELNLTDSVSIKVESDEDTNTIQLFPSVKAGPVDISKAEKYLDWRPTDYKTVLKDTVRFYERAIKLNHFDRERKQMIRTMQTYFAEKPYDVIQGIWEIYGISFGQQRDEL